MPVLSIPADLMTIGTGALVSLHDGLEANGYQDPALTLACSALLDDFRRGDVFHAPAHTTALSMYLGRVPAPFWRTKAEKPNMQWDHLDHLCEQVLRGNKNVLPAIQKVIDTGYLAEMALAIEHANLPDISNEDRDAAFVRLRSLEESFDAYWKDPKGVSLQEKHARVALCHNGAKKQGLDLDLDDEEILNFLYNLVQIHEFLHLEAKAMNGFGEGLSLSGLSDFLLGRLNPGEWNGGSCFPMAVLASHLGRRINILLKAYFSESHVSLSSSVGGGFLYEPNSLFWIDFLVPPNQYVLDLKAPGGAPPVSDAEFLLFPTLMALDPKTCLSKSGCIDILKDFFPDNFGLRRFLVEHLYTIYTIGDDSDEHMRQWDYAIWHALTLFPNDLPVRLCEVYFLIQNRFDKKALEKLDAVWTIIEKRQTRQKNRSRFSAVSVSAVSSYYRLRKYLYQLGLTDAETTLFYYRQILALLPPKSPEAEEVAKRYEELVAQ